MTIYDEMHEEAEARFATARRLMGEILEISQACRQLWSDGRISFDNACKINRASHGIDFPFMQGYSSLKHKDYEMVDWCLRVMESRKAMADLIYAQVLKDADM